MAAEVTSLLRIINPRKDEKKLANEPTVLITLDLLGSCSKAASADRDRDRDLDLQVPTAWEKRLDFKSTKACPRSFTSRNPPESGNAEKRREQPAHRDLNVLPLNPLEDSCLELKLLPSSHYQSACTLDKVKSALQRAGRETAKKRPSPPVSLSSSLTLREEDDDDREKQSWSLTQSSISPAASSGMFAAGCPGCLLYVMTYTNNPKCPRCHSIVPSPALSTLKKPRIDLNTSF